MQGNQIVPRRDGRLIVSQMLYRIYGRLRSVFTKADDTYVFGKYFQQAEVIGWIDEGYQYFLEVIRKSFEGETEKEFIHTLSANQAEYPLPGDWLKTTKILLETASGKWDPLEYKFRPDGTEVTTGVSVTVFPPNYHFRGDNLVIDPPPSEDRVNGLKHRYQSILPSLRETGDIPARTFLPQWIQAIIFWAVVQGRLKEGSDAAPYMAMLAKVEQSLREYCENRSTGRQYVEMSGVPETPEEEGDF